MNISNNGLEALFPQLSQEEQNAARIQRKDYCLKGYTANQKLINDGFTLLGGQTTKCLDCQLEQYEHRLGCICHSNLNEKDIQGVLYGFSLITKLGDGFDNPVVHESIFIDLKALIERIKNGERFYDVILRKELFLSDFQTSR